MSGGSGTVLVLVNELPINHSIFVVLYFIGRDNERVLVEERRWDQIPTAIVHRVA